MPTARSIRVWNVVLLLAWSIWAVPAAQASDVPVAESRERSSETFEPVTILMTEYALGPGEVGVVGGSIHLRLMNAGIRRHTLTILIDGVEHVSPEVRAGDAADWLLQIERPGRYDLWCNEYRHLEKGMGATLVVSAP